MVKTWGSSFLHPRVMPALSWHSVAAAGEALATLVVNKLHALCHAVVY